MFFKETNIFPSADQNNYRIPSLVVTNDGTVLAFCSNRIGTRNDHAEEIALVCAIKKPGEPWSEIRTLAHLTGWRCNIGSAVYDHNANRVIVFYNRTPIAQKEFHNYTAQELEQIQKHNKEKNELAAKQGITVGLRRLVSDDNFETYIDEPHQVTPTLQTHWDGTRALVSGNTHGCEHGICLRHGKHSGRLLCPSRTYIGQYHDWEQIKSCAYNNAIYSDDHGKTWKASQCVQLGTGEGALIERADSSILYNSRAYFRDGKRYLAESFDGGETYENFTTDDFLLEEKRMGCNASLLRLERSDFSDASALPKDTQDLVVFCNPRAEKRERMTACISFDSGLHFYEGPVIFDGPAAYSSLNYDKHTGHFFLLYEKGDVQNGTSPYTLGLSMAEFDLPWLLQNIF